MRSRRGVQVLLATALLLCGPSATAIVTETKLLDANDGGPDDRIGFAVAIDGSYAIAGAPVDGSMGADAGKAVVYFHNGVAWTQQDDLFPTTSPAEGRFGWSVDIDGDRAVVGAPYHQAPAGTSTGVAYVFERSGTSWLLDDVLVPADGGLDDHFGTDVAIQGDTVVVGASGHDVGSDDDEGAVYVYTPVGGIWTLEQKIDGEFGAGTAFGFAVDVWGSRMVVATGGDGGAGWIATYWHSGGLWLATQLLQGNDLTPNDGFGASLQIYDERVLAGANAHFHTPSDGVGYVFERDGLGGVWPQTKELIEVAGVGVPDNLGWSAGLEGDLAALGGHYGDGATVDSGLVYAYRRGNTGNWHEVAALTASDGVAHHNFGSSAGVSGDCVIVGAPSDDDLGAFAGAVYVYCGIPDLLLQVEIDIICCIQIPDYSTGPVEYEIRIENVSMQPRTLTRRVELMRPDGSTVEVEGPRQIELLEGETYKEGLRIALQATDPPGDYAIVAYWQEGESTQTEVTQFALVEGVPGLSPGGVVTVAGALIVAGLWAAAHGRRLSARRTA